MAHQYTLAGVAELADALDLGSSAARRGGSTPFTRTINFITVRIKISYAFCGSSSVVEHHLAKVGVASSNLVFRSKIRRHSQVVRHRSAPPLPPVQIRLPPPFFKNRISGFFLHFFNYHFAEVVQW